ncbi:MAG: hypothetical protein OES24_07105 [Acidimicrobiia bacterium]|nr:hypothetical protein [Acidimicrobiia bacterium]
MTEWPDHPRLTDALRRLADDVDTPEDHRQAVLARLLQDSPEASKSTRRERSRPKISRSLRPSPSVAAVAVAAAVVLSGLMIAYRSRPTTEATIEAGDPIATVTTDDHSSQPTAAPEDNGSATTPAPGQSPPELIPANSCNPGPTNLTETEFLLTIDKGRSITIGAQALEGTGMAPGGLGLIDFGDSPDWRMGRKLDVVGPSRVWLAYLVPGVVDVDTALQVIDDILANACQSAMFAAIPPNMKPIGTAVSCRTLEAGPTLNGVLLIDPAEPPTTCAGSTPTLIARTGLGDVDATDAWASAYGCLGSSSDPLIDGATIVTFADCRHRLALVDLQGPIIDLWTDPDLAGAIVDQLLQLR